MIYIADTDDYGSFTGGYKRIFLEMEKIYKDYMRDVILSLLRENNQLRSESGEVFKFSKTGNLWTVMLFSNLQLTITTFGKILCMRIADDLEQTKEQKMIFSSKTQWSNNTRIAMTAADPVEHWASNTITFLLQISSGTSQR